MLCRQSILFISRAEVFKSAGVAVTTQPQLINGAASNRQQRCIGRRSRLTSLPLKTTSWHGAVKPGIWSFSDENEEKYGVFVRLEPGIEGLIHISKLTGEENIEIGQKIKAYIERVNKKDRRMSLLLPQTEKPIL